MNAEEIREIVIGEYDSQPGAAFQKNNREEKKLLLAREVAAQLAEANEHLKFIAHPMMEVNATAAEAQPTLRDQLAMAALNGYIGTEVAAFWQSNTNHRREAAYRAYTWADLMLEARRK